MSKRMFTPGSGGGKKPAQAGIPDELLPFVSPPPPRPSPSEPIVPLVIYTAFDIKTAEELKKRLENRPRPVHDKKQPKPETKPDTVSIPDVAVPVDFVGEEVIPDISQLNLEQDWSSEDPFLGMNAAELSYYNSAQEDELVRGVAISLRHEKQILAYLDDPIEYLKRFATYTWDEESDEAAEKFIQWYVARFRTELEWQRDIIWSGDVAGKIEDWIKDLANDERESAIAIDLDSDDTIFLRYGDEDSVTLQKNLKKLVEERNIVLIHNHPNNTAASLADLDAADWLDAEYMIVVTRDGIQYPYARQGDTMAPLDPIHNPDYVAAADPLETLAADVAYLLQTLREIGNPAEMVMLEDEQVVTISVTGTVQWATEEEPVILDEGPYGDILYENATSYRVVGRSRFNSFVILVETVYGQQFWLDLNEHSAKEKDSTKYEIIGADNLADIPYTELSAAVLDNPYDDAIKGEVIILPIAPEYITRVLEFGVLGDAWKKTAGAHPGYDFFAPAGTDVIAIASGEVIAVFVPADVNYEHVYGASVASNTGGQETGEIAGSIYDPQSPSVPARQWYGDDWVIERSHRAYVIVRSGNAFITYGHLDPNSIQLGTHVITGQTIGTVGKDDEHEDGKNDHLHLEFRTHAHNPELLDGNDEYVFVYKDPDNQSFNYRPPVYSNTLYLFTEEMRQRILEDYDLDPLADQTLAIVGDTAISHNDGKLSNYWLDSTWIKRSVGGN